MIVPWSAVNGWWALLVFSLAGLALWAWDRCTGWINSQFQEVAKRFKQVDEKFDWVADVTKARIDEALIKERQRHQGNR